MAQPTTTKSAGNKTDTKTNRYKEINKRNAVRTSVDWGPEEKRTYASRLGRTKENEMVVLSIAIILFVFCI